MTIPLVKSELVKTERLTLHPYREEDLDALVELITNPEVTKTFMIPDYPEHAQFVELAKKLISFSRVEDTRHLDCGIYLGDTLIGFFNDCGGKDEMIEVGYVIHPDYWGHGYASEVLRAMYGELRRMGYKRVRAGFFEENPASRRVMEKCGMHLIDETDEDEYRGKVHKCFYCEIEL